MAFWESTRQYPTWRAVGCSFVGLPLPRTARKRQSEAPGVAQGRRRFPLRYEHFKNSFKLGTAAVVIMVLLRLSLGCHFFYEGVWKITHPEFSAAPYLRMAKGPAAPLFHAMLEDIDGRDRLKTEQLVSVQPILAAWKKVRDDCEIRYAAYVEDRARKAHGLDKKDLLPADVQAEIGKAVNDFRKESESILWQYEDDLAKYLADQKAEIIAYFTPSEEPAADEDNAEGFPEEVKVWLSKLGEFEQQYRNALLEMAGNDPDRKNAVGRTLGSAGALVPQIREDTLPGDIVRKADKIVKENHFHNFKGTVFLSVFEGSKGTPYLDAIEALPLKVEKKYGLDEDQKHAVDRLRRRYLHAVAFYLEDKAEEIVAYFGSLKRHEDRRRDGTNGAIHEKERVYKQQQDLRADVNVWLTDLEDLDAEYREAVWGVLTDQQKDQGPLPKSWTREDWLSFTVTYSLMAIGLCLLLGLFTRPAALGGACFMFFIILTQPNWPAIYPGPTPAEGHALLIDKNFIEMMALLVVATTAVGRWAGLDYFVETYVLRLFGLCKNQANKDKDKDAQDDSES